MEIKMIVERFTGMYHSKPVVFRSPGRINLIGEHTDYNDGFVLPAAIDKAVYVAVNKRNDDEIHLYSQEFDEIYKTVLSKIHPVKGWPDYVLGVIYQLQKRGVISGGFNIVLEGDIPIGAGLSSSAAVECATAYALNDLFQCNIERMTLVKMAQKAEHEFAGVQCGIMDQFASMFGKKEHVIRLDCRTLEYEYFPFKMDAVKIVLLDTKVKHSLASSEYNVRRLQCEEGVLIIRQKYPSVKNLRDVTVSMLEDCLAEESIVYKRCRYVVEENLRLQAACRDLLNDNLEAFGKKMYQTHQGLSKWYEVSCKELDFLVDAVKNEEAVLGARMMGGGFGGCTINLVKKDTVESVIQKVSAAYQEKMQKELKAYVVQIEGGTSKIN